MKIPDGQRFGFRIKPAFTEYCPDNRQCKYRDGNNLVTACQQKPDTCQKRADCQMYQQFALFLCIFCYFECFGQIHAPEQQGQPDKNKPYTQTVINGMPPENLPEFFTARTNHQREIHCDRSPAPPEFHLPEHQNQSDDEQHHKAQHSNDVCRHGYACKRYQCPHYQ